MKDGSKEAYAKYNIDLAWGEFEKSGEIANYAECVLQSADFFKLECDRLTEENVRLTEIAAAKSTRCDELYEALERIVKAPTDDMLHGAMIEANDLLEKIEGEK